MNTFIVHDEYTRICCKVVKLAPILDIQGNIWVTGLPIYLCPVCNSRNISKFAFKILKYLVCIDDVEPLLSFEEASKYALKEDTI